MSARPDIRFETQWLNYVITADCMYWQDSTCFFTVCLTSVGVIQYLSFCTNTSLSKHKHKCWQDIGVFACKYQAAHDWTLIEQDFSIHHLLWHWSGLGSGGTAESHLYNAQILLRNNNQTQ